MGARCDCTSSVNAWEGGEEERREVGEGGEEGGEGGKERDKGVGREETEK